MTAAPAPVVWTPPPGQEDYYNTRAPQDAFYTAHQVILPWLPAKDPTYGRGASPRSPAELAIRDNYPHWDGKVLTGAKKGDEWVAFQVWEPKEGVKNNGKTLTWAHGINDYGGKFSMHAEKFLSEGYSICAIDLPSHGRSTGIHVHLPDFTVCVTAVYEVLRALLQHDHDLAKLAASDPSLPFTQTRELFVGGQSLGGWVAAATCLRFGSTTEITTEEVEDVYKPKIAGGVFLCPMLGIVEGSRPSYAIELVARGIASFAGALPLAGGHKGKTSEDVMNEQMFLRDPQTYHGKLRVSTGLAILQALVHITPLLPNLSLPFTIHHGTGDRVTNYTGSQKLLEQASSTDKQLKLYEGYEHILLRKGKDEEDDKRRQHVLGDVLEWLERH